MKNYFLGIVAAAFLVGCGSSDSDTAIEVSLWNYMVPSNSTSYNFDKIITEEGVTTSTEIATLTHQYDIVDSDEVNGSWRMFEGVYSIKREDGWIKFSYLNSEPNPVAYVGGGFHEIEDTGNFLYTDSTGGASYSSTFGDESWSYTPSSGECILNKQYPTITLFDGYSYDDVIEIKCTHGVVQKYSNDETSLEIDGVNESFEYYQKDKGFIAKVDKNCYVATEGAYDLLDDNSSSCIKTTTIYYLLGD